MTLDEFLKLPGAKVHDGGPCPVEVDVPVEILVRGGEVTSWARAAAVVWRNDAWIAESYTPLPWGCQVIAYREVQP